MNIFLMDNDFDFRFRAKQVLKRANYNVITADGVIDGFDILNENRRAMDLLILDIMMPVDYVFDLGEARGGLLTGAIFFRDKVCEEIYKNEAVPPVLFLTAIGSELEKDVKDLLKDVGGEILFIQKQNLAPDLRELLPKVKNLLENQGCSV